VMRIVVIAIGSFLLGIAIWTGVTSGPSWPASVIPAVFGVLILASIFFEKRYRGARGNAASWQPTTERFIDPTNGKLVEVRYNPQTGERAYVPIDPE
jgi:hypothetical protein